MDGRSAPGAEWFSHEAEVIWDVRREAPEVFAQLPDADRAWFEAWCGERETSLPVAQTYRPFGGEQFYRPLGHSRSLYHVIEGTPGHNVCLKGTESLSPDVAEELAQAPQRDMYSLYTNQLEWWLRVEQKAPFAYTVKEGLEEAKLAAAFQADYAARYGSLAKFPVPIRVYRLPKAAEERYRDTLLAQCTPQIRDLAEFVLSSGLAVYVYCYQGSIARLPSLIQPTAGARGGYRGRVMALQHLGMLNGVDLERTFDGWLQLAVRMLALGYLPTAYAQDFTGQSVRWVNCYLDGGFADPDSVRKIAEVRSEQDFYQSFWFLVQELASDVAIGLCGWMQFSNGFWSGEFYPGTPYALAASTSIVWDGLRKHFAAEQSAGASFDPRLSQLFDEGLSVFARLDRVFDSVFPPQSQYRPPTVGDIIRGTGTHLIMPTP
ncbi:MAG TPA: hypothetical protein VEO54_16480 [Thermoanaerobaculia bacterium]|nr:hypothetical protein [Thermoanaerobaculia bacterium]